MRMFYFFPMSAEIQYKPISVFFMHKYVQTVQPSRIRGLTHIRAGNVYSSMGMKIMHPDSNLLNYTVLGLDLSFYFTGDKNPQISTF